VEIKLKKKNLRETLAILFGTAWRRGIKKITF